MGHYSVTDVPHNLHDLRKSYLSLILQVLQMDLPLYQQTESGFNLKVTRASIVKPDTAHRWAVPVAEPGEPLVRGGPTHEPP